MMIVKYNLKSVCAITMAVVAIPASSVLMKYAGDSLEHSYTTYLMYFIPGLLIGLLNSIGTTLALRYTEGNRNIIFATIGGPGVLSLYITLGIVFEHHVTWWEYLGIAMIVWGTLSLHYYPKSRLENEAKLAPAAGK